VGHLQPTMQVVIGYPNIIQIILVFLRAKAATVFSAS